MSKKTGLVGAGFVVALLLLPSQVRATDCSDADFNVDGIVDMRDYSLLVKNFLTANSEYDVTGDGLVDVSDYSVLVSYFLQSCGASSSQGRDYETSLLSELVGYGEGTTGGAGGEVIRVTTLSNSGTGSLREALARAGPKWVVFDVDGTIRLSSGIRLNSDTTIDGRGADITITDWGLYVEEGVNNVIINNIKFVNGTGDAIRVYRDSHHVWVHHNTIENWTDGAVDVTEGSSLITLSYNKIQNHDKAMIVGNTGVVDEDWDDVNTRWTGHHNYYDNVVQRLPSVSRARAHSFNNYFQWRSGFAMNVVDGAHVLSENDIFEPISDVNNKLFADFGTPAFVKYVNPYGVPYGGCCFDFSGSSPEQVFDPGNDYAYRPDVADERLRQYIIENAGWRE